jgi:oligosaccharide amylase
VAKSVNLGNGRVLIGLDKFGRVKDFYFHYPGLENHISEHLVHKIGIFVEDKFSWISERGWEIEIGCHEVTMASDIKAKNDELGIELYFCDIVYNEKNIFIREVTVNNLFDRHRIVKVFFNQQFNIAQTRIGDTAYYDPRDKVIIHYKGRRVFLINAQADNKGFSDYGVGLLKTEGKDGTYRDAEDGSLSKNGIEHGQVDSVIAVKIEVEPNSKHVFHYWIVVAKSIKRARFLNELVLKRHPTSIIKSTCDYWNAWVKHQNFSFYGLGPPIVELFNRSLINIRTHVSDNGAIIASGDSDLLQFGRDTYAYVWPRDAAFTAIALERAGDFNASRRFFKFCSEIITPDGYFMHKYRPNGALGSSWHPWVKNGREQIPIQEDETALVIYALWQHYVLSKDLEFVEEVYNSLIKKAAEFMVNYRNKKTGLPKPSYDLWEQTYGVSTFTCSTVYGALHAAAKFANLLGKTSSEEKYLRTAEEVKKGILEHLYDKKEGIFYKQLDYTSGEPVVDRTIDMSSLYGMFKFEVLPINDANLKKAMEKTTERLEIKTDIGGIARYEGDAYHFSGGNIAGNPWVITAMWLAQYHVALAKKESDLEIVKKWISWVLKIASKSGVLPEQINPYTGEHLSAAPLAWSHAEFVTTIIEYLEKIEELGICKACYPLN